MTQRLLPAATILLALALAGCAVTEEGRRLVEIYRPDSAQLRATARSIVFVPGTMGSRLVDSNDGDVVWGQFWNRDESEEEALALLALPYRTDVPIRELEDSLVPGGQLLSVELDMRIATPRIRVYPGLFEGIVEALVSTHTHERPEALTLDEIERGENPIVGFGYDWRKDLSAEAARLHEVVLAASRARAAATGDSRVDIVAHSLGTQLVRYYLRYGDAPLAEEGPLPEVTWAGAELVRRVILIAPPNRGEASALSILVHGTSVAPLLPHYPAAVTGTFASAYQMLPRVGEGRIVYTDGGDVDVYDVSVWRRYAWGPFAPAEDERLRRFIPDVESREARLEIVEACVARQLAYAQRFHAALDRPSVPPVRLGMHLVVGDMRNTVGVIEVDRETGRIADTRPEAGDGTVTRTSALGQTPGFEENTPTIFPDSVHFVGGEHTDMVGNPDLVNLILYLVLQAPPPELRETYAYRPRASAGATSGTPPTHGGENAAPN